jgi:hypothetical protein
MLYGSFLIMSVAGATSVFAVYSKDIKERLGYTQEQLNTVGFFMDLGANVGVHAGLIAEVTPPWFVLATGAMMNLGGYLMLYLSVAGRIGISFTTPLWLVCLYIFVGANSQAFAHTGALVNSVRSFPRSRGAMLGLLKGFLGLSGAIYSQLYLAFSGGRSSDSRPLILLVGSLPAAISVALIGTIRSIPGPQQVTTTSRDLRAFRCLLYLSLALAAYLMVAIILEKRFHFNPTEYGLSAGIIAAMLLLPLVIVQREEAAAAAAPTNETSETMADGQQALSVVDVATELPPPPAPEATAAVKNRMRALRRLRPRPPSRGHDHTILDALVSVDMLLLLAATAFGVGGVLTAVYNIGQIGESLGYPQRSIATFVSLVSIWSYLGRVTSGFGLDTAFVRKNLTSPLLMLIVLLLAIPGHLLIAFGVAGSLYPASMVIGFCHGATQPLILAIKSELFGLKYYSTICNLGPTVCPVGTYILNVQVAGRMYDKVAARQSSGDLMVARKVATCIGVRCYRESFLIIAVATAAAAAMTATLAWRTWEFYAEYRTGRSKAEMDVSDGGVVPEANQQVN